MGPRPFAILVAAALALTAAAPAKADLDIANVTLGMNADQAMAALRQTYGRSIMDWRVYDQSVLDVVKINRDMNYPKNKIFYSVNLSNDDKYINHIFYNIQDTYVGRTSVIIDLVKAPDGQAKVYQVLQVTRGGSSQQAVFEEVSDRAASKYGVPVWRNEWCAEPTGGQCPADQPHLALYLIKEPVQAIKSVLQLYDPRYGTIGPEAVGSAEDAGTLSFGLHTQ